MTIELDNALFRLKHVGERKAATILRKAIADIKALIPDAWETDVTD